MKSSLRISSLLAPLLLSQAFAANLSWDISPAAPPISTGSGTWDTTLTNWTTDGGTTKISWNNTTNAGDTAVFGASAASTTITLTGTINLHGITMTGSALNTAQYIVTGGTLNFGGTQGSIDTSATDSTSFSATPIISSALTGTAGLTIAASGNFTDPGSPFNAQTMLRLNGDNTGLSGGITITSGVVARTNLNAFGTNLITLNGGGIVDISQYSGASGTYSNAIKIGVNGGAFRTFGTATSTISGALTADIGSASFKHTGGGALNFTGDLSGFTNGTFDNQVGDALVNGTTAAAGNWTQSSTGTMRIGASSLGSGGTLTLNAGTLSSNAAAGAGDRTLGKATTIGGNVTLGNTTNTGVLAFTNTVALGTAVRTLTTASAVSMSGVISGVGGGITKAGTSTLTLSDTNSYSGATAITAGALNIRNSDALGGTSAGTSVTSGAALELQHATGITVGAEALALNGTGISNGGGLRNISGTNTYGGVVTLGGASRINSDAGSLTLSAGITGTNQNLTVGGAGNTSVSTITTGTGTLTKDGGGTLTLTGTSTYSGATTVSAGTLLVSGALGATAVSVTGGATIGGDGTIAGTLNFASGTNLVFSTTETLSVAGGVSFGSGFGVDNLVGLTSAVGNGTYTLIDTTGTNFAAAGLENFGLANAYDLGAGKSAYFQQGSLQLVVIPEPAAALLGSLGLLALLRRRRA